MNKITGMTCIDRTDFKENILDNDLAGCFFTKTRFEYIQFLFLPNDKGNTSHSAFFFFMQMNSHSSA